MFFLKNKSGKMTVRKINELKPPMDARSCWNALTLHCNQTEALTMRQLFASDDHRFQRYSLEAAGLFLDYSKNRLTDETLQSLLQLARASGLEDKRAAMRDGQKINTTEHRAVLHTALRRPWSEALVVDGRDVMPDIRDVLLRLRAFTDKVRNGEWRGHSGLMITDVVHIGIGGSDLGPRFACEALTTYRHECLRVHFVANVDAHDLHTVLTDLVPASTLFVIASKTFITMETMMNAHTARTWCLDNDVPEAELHRHFAAVSTNLEGVRAFGIDVDNMFPLWDWVGGRYSLWSAIGVPIALQCGMDVFMELLAGAHAMDEHFFNAPLEANMPVLLALIGIWNANFLGARTVSIAPYHQHLQLLGNHLQQLDMESNGKSVNLDGFSLTRSSGPVIWGQAGTNGQHAYFQWLHQGTEWAPVDFVAVIRPTHSSHLHHEALLANCFAQSEALMKGKSLDEVSTELRTAGRSAEEIDRLAPHKVFPGNRPSNTILLPYLDPFHLGALIALYEHKVFVQGAIWGVNSFDQWGVELGKVLAVKIQKEMAANQVNPDSHHDASTQGLIERALRLGA